MEAPLIDDLAKSKDLIGDLLKLSKSQLLNIWKRLWPLSEKDFCMQYGLTKSTDATLSNSEVVLEAPCPNCKTMIILEKHARFDCPNCTKYNSWYIKINKNQLSSKQPAFSGMKRAGKKQLALGNISDEGTKIEIEDQRQMGSEAKQESFGIVQGKQDAGPTTQLALDIYPAALSDDEYQKLNVDGTLELDELEESDLDVEEESLGDDPNGMNDVD